MKCKLFKLFMTSVFMLSMGSVTAQAAVGGSTIGGCIYKGYGEVTYVQDALGEPIANWTTYYAPSAFTPPISDAQVMVQNQKGGAVVGLATMGLDANGIPVAGGNCWEMTIADEIDNATGAAGADGIPDAEDLVVMFAAPGHNLTSREFTWNAVWGEFTHPKQGGGVVGPVDIAGSNPAAADEIGAQDAYLPALQNVNPVTGAGITETANLLHYVFYDNFTNGGDNGPMIDPGLNGVTVTVKDLNGYVVQTQRTGDLAFSQGGFVTKDGLPFLGSMAYGYVYFQGLPGGQTYMVTSDPTTVTQVDNPHMTLRVDHTNDNCSLESSAAGPYGYNNTTCNWYQTFTEMGGHAWDAFLWPGDPGTEMGFYLTWHAFVEKLGNSGGGNPVTSGTLSGILVDADGNDPAEPFPQVLPGRVPPTNARYEDGTPWNVNLNAGGWGGCLDPLTGLQIPCPNLGADVTPNGRIPDAIVALYSTFGGVPKLVATTEASQPSLYNSPDGGVFTFTNIPPGTYEIFAFDKDLVNVPVVGTALNVIPGVNPAVTILNPRFNARGAGFVMNNGTPVDATVKVQFNFGATQRQTDTNPVTGWFEIPNLPETGALGKFYVDVPEGASYRGKILTETFQRQGPLGLIYTDATHNAMSRALQWWTLNYFVDLQVETIPAGVGNILGAVFSDSIELGDWQADGLWNEALETALPGESVGLYAATIDPLSGSVVCPDLSGLTPPLPVATAVTGDTNETDAKILGWVPVGTWPPQELGGVFADPVVCDTGNPLFNCSQTSGLPAPAYGFYEFRDVLPGAYCVKVAPKAGFRHSPEGNGLYPIMVSDGLNNRVDLGVTSTPTAPLGGLLGNGVGACVGYVAPVTEILGACSISATTTCIADSDCLAGETCMGYVAPVTEVIGVCDNNNTFSCLADTDCANLPAQQGGVPLAGLLEGGLFSGNGDLDPNPLSTMFDEAMNIVGGPVGVYDQFNYLLGIMYQTDAWCNDANNAVHIPGSYPADPLACSSATDTIQPPEMARYFAPGTQRYAGNDPSFIKDPAIALPDANGITFAGNDKTKGFDPRFETMELGAGMMQNMFLAEFAWTPLTPINGSISAPICAIGISGTTFSSEPYGAIVTVKVSDGYIPVAGATIQSSAAGNNGEACITNGLGECTISFEKFEGAGDTVVFMVNNITTGDPWYVYNPTPGGILAGACQTSLTLYDPAYVPPPTPVMACADGIDNDNDGLIDYPADPGCLLASDNNESDVVPAVYACSDGLDNDLDGLIDFPADPGCASATDMDETDPPVEPVFACSDLIDNDGDGLVDMADPGCANVSDNDETDPPGIACNDGIDNDGDGLVDLADPGCANPSDTDEFNAPLPICSDGIDNDGDGLTDFPADPGCLSASDIDETDPVYACSDGIDNDGDGRTDFPADLGCASATDNDEFNLWSQCNDNIDNDGDGLTDMADPGCTDINDNDETDPVYACSDGIDNDGDGLIDFPADPGCLSATDNDEFNAPLAQCSDGIDNDGDGLVDMADPGCTDANDNDETDPVYACSDGIDNDGDTLVDFPADPGCLSATDNNEYNAPLPSCSDFIDNDGDGLIDMADPGCTNANDNDETDPLPLCSDGIDNDGDGLVDMADPGCADPADNDEYNAPLSQCSDGIDNDGDGLIDLADPGCADSADNDETNAPPRQCADGIDNDGDGLIDMADAGCTDANDNDETDVATSIHASSLTGAASYREGKLRAAVTVKIVDNLGNSSQGANVSMTYTWSKEGKPTSKPMSCTTNASGTCTANTSWMEKASTVSVRMDSVAGALVYRPQDDTVASPITVP